MKTNPLANLKIDYWYKALVVISSVVFLLSLTVKLEDIENNIVQLISLGLFFIGLGEWINHPLQTALMCPNIYDAPGGAITTSYKRSPRLTGNLFDILGFILCSIAIVKIFS